MTEPTRLLCSPWITLADLPADKPALDDATWEDLCWQASEMLYVWSGKQFSGGCASTVILDKPPETHSRHIPLLWRWESPWLPRGFRGVQEPVVARLLDSPVTSIDQVLIGSTELVEDVDYHAELPVGKVWRADYRCWPTDGTASITYRHGLQPPIGGQRAAALLAVELGKSWSGAKCNLPKRIESITREGLTVNLATALQGWRTGIWDIDAWLLSVNPHMLSRRASAWSPDSVHVRRSPA